MRESVNFVACVQHVFWHVQQHLLSVKRDSRIDCFQFVEQFFVHSCAVVHVNCVHPIWRSKASRGVFVEFAIRCVQASGYVRVWINFHLGVSVAVLLDQVWVCGRHVDSDGVGVRCGGKLRRLLCGGGLALQKQN